MFFKGSQSFFPGSKVTDVLSLLQGEVSKAEIDHDVLGRVMVDRVDEQAKEKVVRKAVKWRKGGKRKKGSVEGRERSTK